jgi:lambda family phage portal protein
MGKRGNAQRRAARRAAPPQGAPMRASAHTVGFVPPGSDTVHRAASGSDQVMAAWHPGTTEPNTTHAWENRTIVDRARDLVTNNPYADAAVTTRVGMVVGTGLRWAPRHEVMAARLGIKPDVASEIATQAQQCFESWADDPLARCDWERDLSFNEMIVLAARHEYIDGDGIAVMRFDKRPDWKFGTSMQVMDPDRLSNPIGRMNDASFINGIETDGRMAVAYHFRDAHPADWTAIGKQYSWSKVPVSEPWGRPIVIHVRDKRRAGQKRGVSRFASSMKLFKQLDQYTEAELSSAWLNAISGNYITTSKVGGEVGAALGMADLKEVGELRKQFYGHTDPRMSNGSRIAVLAPGDELKMNAVARHVASFVGFITTGLQGCAAPLGLTGSQLTMDFSKTNFSSWRGEQLQQWRDVMVSRLRVSAQMCNRVLLCILEEGIDIGDIDVPSDCPDLYENPHGWLSGRWNGPPRGSISPKEDVETANLRVAGGYSSLEDEVFEMNGGDYESFMGQVAYEVGRWAEHNLTPTALRELLMATDTPMPGAAKPAPAPDPAPENRDAGNQGDQREGKPAPDEDRRKED